MKSNEELLINFKKELKRISSTSAEVYDKLQKVPATLQIF